MRDLGKRGRSAAAHAPLVAVGGRGPMRLCFVVSAALLAFHVMASPAEAAYAFWKAITVNAGQVSGGPLTNFPFLFSTTDPDLRTTANGGRVTSANGYDIVFQAKDTTTCGGPPAPSTTRSRPTTPPQVSSSPG